MQYCNLIVLLFFTCYIHVHSSDVIYTLPNGQIKGRIVGTKQNISFYAFQEIPYAAPPKGSLRFKPPQPVQNWNGVLSTVTNTKMCIQNGVRTSQETEDCLYLNVYTPIYIPYNRLIPVIVFIHGGNFESGDAMYNSFGPHYFIQREVVVVTINYRLGAFGFLSTEDNIVSGNNGLKDQLQALQWVKSNIQIFNGDPTKITIIGQGAGAASVTYHLLSKKSDGLFRAAIVESGSALNPWAYQRNAASTAYELARNISSNFTMFNTTKELLTLLQSVDAFKIKATTAEFSNFGPVIEKESEDAFITKSMYEILSEGNANKIPLFIGINSEELIKVAADTNKLKDIATIMDVTNSEVNPDLNILDENKKRFVGKNIQHAYVKSKSGKFRDDLASAVRFFSDDVITRGVMRYAELQSNFSDVYFYKFSYHGKLGKNNVSMNGTERVSHGEELNYLWVQRNTEDLMTYPKSDILTAKRFMKLILNFVKTLNPTPDMYRLLNNVRLPKVSPNQFYFLDINKKLTVQMNPKLTYRKWVEIYRKWSVPPLITY